MYLMMDVLLSKEARTPPKPPFNAPIQAALYLKGIVLPVRKVSSYALPLMALLCACTMLQRDALNALVD